MVELTFLNMMSRERRIRRLNQVIQEHGYAEAIFDKGAIFQLLELLREALERIEENPETALILGVLIDEKTQSSIAPGVLAARVVCVVGAETIKLIPEVKTYSEWQLQDKIDNFMDNFDV